MYVADEVFPAWAGVNLAAPSYLALFASIPCVGGGEPFQFLPDQLDCLYSPRERG